MFQTIIAGDFFQLAGLIKAAWHHQNGSCGDGIYTLVHILFREVRFEIAYFKLVLGSVSLYCTPSEW